MMRPPYRAPLIRHGRSYTALLGEADFPQFAGSSAVIHLLAVPLGYPFCGGRIRYGVRWSKAAIVNLDNGFGDRGNGPGAWHPDTEGQDAFGR